MFCSILYIAKSYENRPRHTKRECTSPLPFRRDDIFTIKSAMKPSEVRRRRRTIIAFSSHLHGITDTVLLYLRGKRESCNSHDRIRLEMELPSERQRCSRDFPPRLFPWNNVSQNVCFRMRCCPSGTKGESK